MAKLALRELLLLLISLAAATQGVQALNAESWAIRLETQKETVTNLQFYFHDTLSGSNPSAVRVAQANNTDKSPTFFGSLMMADDPLTESPDPKSKLLGYAQGLYGSACQTDVGLLMAMNFEFVDGSYNGSSISLLGKNSALHPVREMAIVGGTGLFRLARGYAIAQTNWLNPLTGDAIVGYNVTIVH
ncbi:dirigent protein 23-like [Tripterygium wilfordii]|uniref:dirigent protein 23-like n=1 Tax=Tripterygium wilfordii TaxID=458696 RepID=UPI0018F7EA02|nr:dirigent protein 23-like [Tripterygium wilfordii]